ncbi:sulfotransferase, partial [Arthrospira platensis SPKY2]
SSVSIVIWYNPRLCQGWVWIGKLVMRSSQGMSAGELLKQANQLKRSGKLEEAIAIYHQVIEINPHFAWAYHNLGDALVKQGNLGEAVACYSRGLKVNPNSARLCYDLGEALGRQGNLDASVNYLQKACHINPHYKNLNCTLKKSSVSKIAADKIFCIGRNKTGTTSIEQALKDLGFRLGNQRQGELLIKAWASRNFQPILQLVNTADAFQDIPFSLPYTYQALDQHFPNAKFILSIRNNAEEWYNSMVNFHSKLWADGMRMPTAEDLKNANYVWKGYPYEIRKLIYNISSDDNLYDKKTLISHYINYNESVCDYFRHRPEKLLIINVSKPDDYKKMCHFIGKEPIAYQFPWLNKSL